VAVVKPHPSLFVSQWSTNSQDFGKQDSVIKEDYVKQETDFLVGLVHM
jgi:hypothetical protein